jgi:hypothetical protein
MIRFRNTNFIKLYKCNPMQYRDNWIPFYLISSVEQTKTQQSILKLTSKNFLQ